MRKIKAFFVTVALLVSSVAFAQKITVTGVVSDASNGEPVPFASIQLKGTMTGASTDANGNYSISVPKEGTLVFSSIGYHSQEAAIAGRAVVNVALNPDSESLNDVIVVAFGTTTKEAFTGSASVVKSDDLAKRQTTNVANALVGSVAGLQMRGSSGQPGAGAGSISIRGISSLYASTEPLIIVDGAPYSASLSNIPQDDIQSVSVLKDAASAALYGARGASGVIIITTKRGQSKDAVVKVDIKTGFSNRAIPDYETISDPGAYYEAYYSQLYNMYYYGQGNSMADANQKANTRMLTDLGYQSYTVPAGETLVGMDGKLNPKATLGYKYTGTDGTDYWITPDNWTDAAYKTAMRKEYNVSVNGGDKKASYYASVGYLNEDGIIEYSGYERLTARVKADYQAKKWLRLGANVGYTNSNMTSNPNLSSSTLSSTNLLYYTSMIAPIYPLYVRTVDANNKVSIRKDQFGNPEYDFGTASGNFAGLTRAFLATGNPIGSNRYNKVYSDGNQLNGNFNTTIDFTKYLKLDIVSSVIWGSTQATDYENAFYGPKVSVNGELTKQSTTSLRTNNTQTLTYYNSFGNHNVNVLVGHEYYQSKSSSIAAVGQGIFSQDILELAATAKKLATTTSSSSFYNVEGYLSSLQYNYDYKYYLSASFRRDASSTFDVDHRWGNFWSLGGAWIVSKENFMSNASWIDELKLKASIGEQGNDGIGNYYYTDWYKLSATGEYTMSPSFALLGNKEITWETVINSNIGTEFSFFGGRLSGSLEVYNKKTKDLFMWVSIPESNGTRGSYSNVGDVANRGVELVLNGSIIRTKDFDWSASFNISHNATKITSLPESKVQEYGGFYEDGLWYTIGGPMYNYMTYSFAGIDDNGKALYWYDEDLSPLGGTVSTNNTSKAGEKKSGKTDDISKATRYAHGSTLPVAFGGFGTSVRYRNFDASVTFDYQLGGQAMDSRYASLMSPSVEPTDAGSNFHVDYIKSWSTNNTSSAIPRWQYGDKYTFAGDRAMTNASYLNFQSFSVGYQIPDSLLKNKFRIRVYALGENLGFISARKGFDPRYSFTGNTSVGTYSPVRTISGGVQFTF